MYIKNKSLEKRAFTQTHQPVLIFRASDSGALSRPSVSDTDAQGIL